MFHEIDCYAMPSRWEGLSSAALQAMAAGAPCVFSDIPSFRTQYPDEVATFHDPESVSELVEGLCSAIEDGDRMRDKRKEFVSENYSIEKMAEGYEDVYRRIL